MITQKTKIRKMFNQHGIQVPIETLNDIDDHIKRKINRYITNCKNNNIKRLKPDLLGYALGRYNI
jgi:23S rRNA maturation-related 3'-5' exoribonuclease YhaM